MRPLLCLLLVLTACPPQTDSSMGTPVSGTRFEQELGGRVFSFRLPYGGQAEAQFQPDGTAVYSGRRLNGIGC